MNSIIQDARERKRINKLPRDCYVDPLRHSPPTLSPPPSMAPALSHTPPPAGLVVAYCKLCMVGFAWQLFEEMLSKDVVAWNAVIAGASRFCEPGEALELFGWMQARLVWCPTTDVEVSRSAFDGMSGKDWVSWGTLVSGYAANRRHMVALELFGDLRRKNLMVNSVAVVAALSGAAETKDLVGGVDIHTYMIERKVKMDASVVTALSTMYAKCGKLEEAKKSFGGMEERDTVAWSAMISVLVQTGRPQEAVFLFREMLMVANVKPNRVTVAAVLPACGELSAWLRGKAYIVML